MRTIKVLIAMAVATAALGIAAPPAGADDTALFYSIKDARTFLTQFAYPQATFISEFYAPCDPATDPYGCDRGAYNQTPGSCGRNALGTAKEAPETPTPEELTGGSTGTAVDPFVFPKGNPVTVTHGLALGHLGSTPEAGGLASMYYVDNSGRRETEAHAESDAYVSNFNTYEERCAAVDAVSEAGMYPGPFLAHVLSRSSQSPPSTYNMAAYTTAESTTPPPGGSKEGVSIVKLYESGGRIHALLTSTVRGLTLAGGQITVDVVRSVISFSSDGTKEGLEAAAHTEALGIKINGQTLPVLLEGTVLPLGTEGRLGVLAPEVQPSADGRQISIHAGGLFLAATTPLDQLPVPEDPLNRAGVPDQLKGHLTLGGHFFAEQAVYVAGGLFQASVGRVPVFKLPHVPIPKIPIPFQPPPFVIPGIVPPPIGPPPVPPPLPVGQAHYIVRELAGSPWPLAMILAFTALGLLGIMGRWSMRFGWARSLSRYPPFPAFGWAYRAFLKD